MKRLNRYLIITCAVAAFIVTSSATAKNRLQKIYAFGFAASFNDSTVYFTDVQEVDSAWLQERTNFLISRNNYSYQLRDYLAGIGQEHRTCIIVYSPKRDQTEKKFIKMRKKYTSKGNFDVKYIASSDFQFKGIEPDNTYQEETQPVKKKKKDRKADRHRKPEGNRQPQGEPEGNGGQEPMQ